MFVNKIPAYIMVLYPDIQIPTNELTLLYFESIMNIMGSTPAQYVD